MMKTKFIPILGMMLTGVKGPVLQTMLLSMDVGPFNKNQDDPSVSYTISSTYRTSKSIYEIFRFGDNTNPNQQTITKANHSVSASGTYTGYVSIPTKTFLNDNGMKITIEIHANSGTLIRTSDCYIYPKKPETINPTTYPSSTYTCPQNHAYIEDGLTSYTNEYYTFTKVDDYFLTDLYYRLPIEQFVINTSLSESEFTYRSAYLKISGLNDYFPSLTYTNGMALIGLDVNYNNGELTFSFQNNLYVHKQLLIMSTRERAGYVATKNFYLPVNHQKQLVGSSFTFVIDKVGYNNSSFMWHTSILAENPLIGDCQSSGYCVVGTVTK